MKKSVFGITALIAAFVFMGCPNPAASTDDGGSKGGSDGQDNVLPASSGENPFAGKTVSNSSCSYTFNSDGTAKMTVASPASTNARSAVVETGESYLYTWNTEKKELYLELTKVWTTSAGQTYKNQLAIAKSTVASTEASVKSQVETSLSAMDTYKTQVAVLGISTDAIKKAASVKIDSIFEAENARLEDYLSTRYESVITFTYDISDDGSKVTFTQKCPSSLAEADAKYTSSTISLNDYAAFKPFYVKNGDSEYAGVPVFDEANSKFTVNICDYFGDILNDSDQTSAYTTAMSGYCTSVINELSTELTGGSYSQIKAISDESQASSDGSSATLSKLVDEKMQQGSLTVTYVKSGNDLALTLSGSDGLMTALGTGTSATVTFVPLYDSTEFTMADSAE